MEKDNKAEAAYKDYCNGMKYKDIASKYDVSLNTVKSWKQRQWKDIEKGVHTKEKSMHTKCTPNSEDKAPPGYELLPEEIETLANEELTEEQRLFCLYYSRSFNATSAYMKAYDRDYKTAMVNGCRLLRIAKIKDEIMKLKQERCARTLLTKEDIFQKYMDIAFADITDFLEFGSEQTDTSSGNVISKNFVYFRHHTEVDGTLIGEVKQGKDGASIKLPDRMKALQWLSDHMGWASELQKAQLAVLKSKVPNTDVTNFNEQIQSIAELINNPVPERTLNDDTVCTADEEAE